MVFREDTAETKSVVVPQQVTKELSAIESGELLELNLLPSGFSFYEFKKIIGRGLYYGEVQSLSKVRDISIDLLVRIFKNTLSEVDLTYLYAADAKALMLVISKWSDPEFCIQSSLTCPLELDSQPCKHTFTRVLQINELPFMDIEKPVRVEAVGSSELSFHPLRISDYLFMEELLLSDSSLQKELIKYALSLNPEIARKRDRKDFNEAYQIIFQLPLSFQRIQQEILDFIDPQLKPILTRCKKCKGEFELNLSLDFSKVFLPS